jgi:hypothetical protein
MGAFGAEMQFVVVSDDMPWAEERFVGHRFHHLGGMDPVRDMLLLAACDHIIMANSTFSWWSAWLRENPNKQIIVPAVWYAQTTERPRPPDLVPSRWTQL